jgi:hypothetical protein
VIGHAGRGRAAVVLLVVLLALPVSGWCQTDSPTEPRSLGDWRAEATRVRQLADNDAPGAYRAAKSLEASFPAQGTDSDRARLLNLLSRIETYLALTDVAATHAREALDLATRTSDRVGQAEADLNIALNSVNQGRLDEMVAATQNSVAALEGVSRPDLLAEALLRTTAMYRRFER